MKGKTSDTEVNREVDSTNSRRRFIIPLLVCILLGLVSGSLYGFGRYSRDLKDILNLTQLEMEMLGVLLDTGNYIGHPITGWIYDHYGCRVACIVAAIIVFIAYSMIHLRVLSLVGGYDYDFEYELPLSSSLSNEQEHFHELSSQSNYNWFVLGTSFFMVGMGSGLGYMAALGSTTKMFTTTSNDTDTDDDTANDDNSIKKKQQQRSLAIGIVAAGYGLSSTLVGISYSVVGMNHFFLLWAVLVATANILGSMVLPVSSSSSHDRNSNNSTTKKSITPFTKPDIQQGGIRDDEEIALLQTRKQQESSLRSYQTMDSLDSDTSESSDDMSMMIMPSSPESTRILLSSPWTSWQTLDFWLLFIAFCGCTGCGLFVINNVSTMVESLGGTDQFAGRLVILLSLCNCFGRIGMGILAGRNNNGEDDDSQVGNSKLPFFTLSSCVMAIGMALSGLTNEEQHYAIMSLVGTVVLVATAYGGTWVLIVGLLADWFGQDHFGKNYGLCAMGPALSGMAFNAISAWTYQQHVIVVTEEEVDGMTSSSSSSSSSSGICLGTVCYHGTFMLCAFAATICMLIFPLLNWRRQRQRQQVQSFPSSTCTA